MTNNRNIKIIERKTLFDGFHKLEDITLQHSSFSKQTSNLLPPTTREVMHCGKAALMLLYHPQKDAILLSQQFRFGVFASGYDNPWIWEAAGGMVDEKEDPKDSAIREAYEETGTTVLNTEFIGNFFTSSGCLDEEFYLYCGCINDADTSRLYGMTDEGEEINTELISVNNVFTMLEQHEIVQGMTALALYWFKDNYSRLKTTWS